MPKNKARSVKVKKTFTLLWALDALQDEESFFCKRMFGGLAAYLHGRMVTVLFENAADKEWNGILYPTHREFHDSLIKQFPELRSHSILGKWLYLPMNAIDFESSAHAVAELIALRDPRIGIEPGLKKKTDGKMPSVKKSKK